MKKIVGLVLSVVLVMSVFAGCVKLDKTVVSVNDSKALSSEEARFYLLFTKLTQEQQGLLQYEGGQANEDASNIDYVALKEAALDYMKRTASTVYVAGEQGFELNEEETAMAKSEAGALLDSYAAIAGTQVEDNDISQETVEQFIADFMLAEKVVGKLQEDVAAEIIPEEEINTFVEEVMEEFKGMDQRLNYYLEEGVDQDKIRAAHILISTVNSETGATFTDEEKAAAKEKLEGVLERAKAGEDFATLAAEFSNDPGSKDNGGEYTFGRYEMVPEFDEAVFGLKVGEFSDVFETDFGFHFVTLYETGIPAVEEDIAQRNEYIEQARDYAKGYAEERIKSEKVEEAYNKMIEENPAEVDEEAWEAVELKVSDKEEAAETTKAE